MIVSLEVEVTSLITFAHLGEGLKSCAQGQRVKIKFEARDEQNVEVAPAQDLSPVL